jgi:hypothetical protein
MSKLEDEIRKIRQEGAQSDKAHKEVLDLITQGVEKLTALSALQKRDSLQKAKLAVKESLVAEREAITQRLRLCEHSREQYRLLIEKQESLRAQVAQNKLHSRFRHLGIEKTPAEVMWQHYGVLHGPEIDLVHDYQLARDVLAFLSGEITRVGALLEAGKTDVPTVIVPPETATLPVTGLPEHRASLAEETLPKVKPTAAVREGRPRRNKVDRTYFELFQNQHEALLMLRLLLDKHLAEATLNNKKQTSETLTDEQLKVAAFKWIGTSSTRSEIAAFVLELQEKKYLVPSALRELSRVFNNFFQVKVDASAYRKTINIDFEEYYKKAVVMPYKLGNYARK